jgi:hypothetical protein
MYWWTLPGPSDFVGRASRALADAACVVVHFPEHTGKGFGPALRAECEADWRELALDGDADWTPAEVILERFGVDLPFGAARDTDAVLRAPRLQGITLMLELEGASRALADWTAFLKHYAEKARNIDAWERPAFCLVVTGRVASPLPQDAPGLEVLEWRGVVSSLDMALYVARRLRGGGVSALERQVVVAIIARMADFDAGLADILCSLELPDLFEPYEALRAYGRRRGWSEEVPADSWACGMADQGDGAVRHHVAALALRQEHDAIRSRIWSGQVAVLFPELEERRRGLIRAHLVRLWVPFHTHDGRTITDVRDLELGHILFQLRSRGVALDSAYMSGIQALVDVRNILAHFDAVPATLLRSSALRAALKPRGGD